MTPPVFGSLFSGYGGLDAGVQSVLGGSTAWHCEVDPAASRVLAHHWPDVPNLGDITAVDWTGVTPVDVLTGGFPCQDVSHAGKRAGIAPGTRSGLWAEMQRAIQALRPALVVAENVRGLLSAKAASDVECCPWCVGDGEGEPPLRALGAVLGDLADLGYDAWWTGLRAADAGAPHGRFRVFIFAWPANAAGHSRRQRDRDDLPAGWDRPERTVADAEDDGRARPGASRAGGNGPADCGDAPADAQGDGRDEGRPEPAGLFGGPHAPERGAPAADPGDAADDRERARPRPRVGGADAAPDPGGERHGRGEDGRALGRVDGGAEGEARERERAREVTSDQGAAIAADADDSGRRGLGRVHAVERDADGRDGADGPRPTPQPPAFAWGDYEPAIRRWEHVTGRIAPAPTEPGSKGQPRLAPVFVEWLMGLTAGWVTSVPGVGRNAQLKALGNGVVPQQAALATRQYLTRKASA